MTILELTQKLLEFFAKNDSFSVEKDFKQIFLLSDNLERDKAAINATLDGLAESKIVVKAEYGSETFWILNRPFNAYEQNVPLGLNVVMALTNVVAKYSKAVGVDIACNPRYVCELDIKNLIYIAEEYVNALDGVQKDIDEN
jgi:hypothetical protein